MRLLLAVLLSVATLVAADPPRRIISTGPGITEILFALGLGDRVVGVTNYCKYPPEQVSKLPKIGTWTAPNMEVILSLKPDLTVVQRTTVHNASKFNAVGLHTIEVSLMQISDIEAAIDAIGKAAGVPDNAAKLNERIRTGLNEIRQRVSKAPPTPALFVVGRNPGSLEGMVAVGPNSYHDELISLAGGRNVLSDAKTPYLKVLHEEIVARNPQVIIDMGEHADATDIPPDQLRRELALWSRYSTVPAVRNKRVHIVSSEIYVVPGPRVVECARQMASMLHPELFR